MKNQTNTRWYELALRTSKDSPHVQKMAAVIVQGGRVLSIAHNDFGKHAEGRAIGRRTFDGATIFIARDGGRMSKPCPRCAFKINRAGIRRVIYADWSGDLVVSPSLEIKVEYLQLLALDEFEIPPIYARWAEEISR